MESGEMNATLPVPPPLPSHKRGITQKQNCCCVPSHSAANKNNAMDRLFDEGYRADFSILTDYGGVIYAHASILGIASPVLKGMLTKLKGPGHRKPRSIPIRGVPPEAVRVFIRFLYSAWYEEEKMREFALPLLVLSHAYAVGELKRLCESWLGGRLMNTENAIDIFQLALLCDAPRLSLICYRFIVSNIKAVSASDGWNAMKKSHPHLEREIIDSLAHEDAMHKERQRKEKERKTYMQLYEAMEALVHICEDGCRTIGPHDKVLQDDEAPCAACKGLEALIRHFAGCKMRPTGGCIHCKRMWQILELHSRLCANSDHCKVPLCRNFRQRRRKQNKKEDVRWRILVKKIVRSKSITGGPFFSLDSS